MIPRDALGRSLGGRGCAACGAGAGMARTSLLAERGDHAVVEIRCRRCGVETLGLILREPPVAHREGARGRTEPITVTDVEAMRRLLAAWEGDLRSLLRPAGHDGAAR